MSIEDDVQASAAWIATALASSGYRADFSPSSLRDVDRFFDEHTRKGKALRRGLLNEGLGQRIFGLGSYVGEVIRRDFGGTWKGDDADPAAEVNITLVLDDGSVIWPVQRVMKRFKNGREDSLVVYASALGVGSAER